MTIKQLSAIKRWLVAHRREQPLEYHTWDAVLTLWLFGWMGMPAEFVLGDMVGLTACATLLAVPTGYVQLRQRLHRRGRVRCDWLPQVAQQ